MVVKIPLSTMPMATALAVLTLAAMPGDSRAASADYYKGKALNVVIGYAPGGVFDVFGRLLGAHLVNHLPGRPTPVPQNMPGASSIRSAEYLYSIAPRDGTAIALFASSAVFAPLLGNKSARYQADKFTWVGNLVQATGTCSVWHTSGISGFDDLRTKPTLFGASAPGGFDSEYPRALNAIFGTKIRVVHGYNGAASVQLAMERGEVQGGCAFPVDALLSLRRQDFQAKRLIPVIQFALKSGALKGVPHIMDFAKNDDERMLYNILFNRDRLGRPVAAPPGLTPDQAQILRNAFDATVRDPAFVEDARKRDLQLNPQNGQEAEAFVNEMQGYPPAIIARAREALATSDAEK